jgi:uncharacterized protein YbcV (DUF1398 family)
LPVGLKDYFAQVPTHYVATKDVYLLKDEPEIIWKEDPVVYAEYGTPLWQIHNQTNKNHKKVITLDVSSQLLPLS